MFIGELMRCAGVTRDTIRHYEAIGLLNEAHFIRLENGYHDYNDHALERVRFIKKAQCAGFKLWQIGKVADDWENDALSQEEKYAILDNQLLEIKQHIQDLEVLKAEIEFLRKKI